MIANGVSCALFKFVCLVATVVFTNITAQSQSGTWTDPATGLTWALHDNGKAVNWSQANNYCRNLNLAGYTNWRLPTIDELAAMHDPNRANRMHIKGGIQVTGWEWSSNTQNAFGEISARTFDFSYGRRDSYPAQRDIPLRALCVRRSGN
jgi:hypothetical protein